MVSVLFIFLKFGHAVCVRVHFFAQLLRHAERRRILHLSLNFRVPAVRVNYLTILAITAAVAYRGATFFDQHYVRAHVRTLVRDSILFHIWHHRISEMAILCDLAITCFPWIL